MPAEIVKQQLRAARRDEYIVLMDDYGSEKHVVIPMSFTVAQRSARLTDAIAKHTAGETEVETYAASLGDAAMAALAAQKTAAMARKEQLKKANGIAPSTAAAPAAPATTNAPAASIAPAAPAATS